MPALLAFMLLLLTAQITYAQPREFRDCPNCPVMLAIPAGGILMGAPPGEEEAEDVPAQYRGFSSPQQRIRFPQGFAISKTPVTRAEYQQFVSITGYRVDGPCRHLTRTSEGAEFQSHPELNFSTPGFSQTTTEPAVCISWNDAQAYVKFLSAHTKKQYRLPSEAEWEYAVRAGTTGPRWWPGGRPNACAHANVRDYTFAGENNFKRDETYFPCTDGYSFTSPVDAFPANPFGLLDALGNVVVWTQDCWVPNLAGYPTNGTARTTGDCTLRVVRGGSWGYSPGIVRAGDRNGVTAGNRSTVLGFRLARTL